MDIPGIHRERRINKMNPGKVLMKEQYKPFEEIPQNTSRICLGDPHCPISAEPSLDLSHFHFPILGSKLCVKSNATLQNHNRL